MKKLTCNSCKKYWLIEDNDIQFQKNCPFCDRTTVKPNDSNNKLVQTFQEAVAFAMATLGEDILLNPSRLSGYILDIAPKYAKEIKFFKKAIGWEYSIYIKDMYGKEAKELSVLVSKYKKILSDNEGLSNTWTDLICDTLHYVFDNNKIMLPLHEITGVVVENVDNEFVLQNNYMLNDSSIAHKTDKLVCNRNACNELIVDSNSQIKFSDSLLYQQAEIYIRLGKYEQAKEIYLKLANSGDVCAMNQLAVVYFHYGSNKKAWKWFLKAADLGNAESQYYVALFNEKQIYVKRNLAVAIKYYKKSANKGYQKAEEALINMVNKMSQSDKQRYNLEKQMKNEWLE